MLCYIPNKTNSLTRNIFLLSGGGVIILSYCLSLILIQGLILTFIHNFYFWTFKLLLFLFYFFALQNKICLIGSCSIFLLIILFVIVFLIVRQFSPDDSWSSSNWESSFQLLLYHSWWSVYFCYLVHFK